MKLTTTILILFSLFSTLFAQEKITEKVTKERTKNYFVLVNGEVDTALVKGMSFRRL
ncbi:MAG: hypothetical protein KAT17_01090 [Candidatus Aminicenantes bacterium]|nr:hypothetical protein [Candidatus Aminicenantes bacterium]